MQCGAACRFSDLCRRLSNQLLLLTLASPDTVPVTVSDVQLTVIAAGYNAASWDLSFVRREYVHRVERTTCRW